MLGKLRDIFRLTNMETNGRKIVIQTKKFQRII